MLLLLCMLFLLLANLLPNMTTHNSDLPKTVVPTICTHCTVHTVAENRIRFFS